MWQYFVSLQFVLLLFIFVMDSIRSCCSENVIFVNRGICRLKQEPQDKTYTLIQEVKVNAVQCARLCWQDGQCAGFNHPGKGTGNCTLRNKSSYFAEICLEPDTDDIFMQKDGVCYNGGSWSQSYRSCICPQADFWVGDYCSTVPVTCDDFMPAGYGDQFKYIKVDPFGVPYRVETLCYEVKGQKTTKANFAKFEPTYSPTFNKQWDDMENGFEEGNTYWIGLKAMRYQIEKVKHKEYYLSLTMDRKYEPSFTFTYYGVHLSDASDGYRLTFSHSKVDATRLTSKELAQVSDCLLESNGSRFSTFDRDMDNDLSENCALKSNAAFWYNECHPKCQPFAVSYDTTSPELFSLAKIRGVSMDFSKIQLWAGNFDRSFMTLVVKN